MPNNYCYNYYYIYKTKTKSNNRNNNNNKNEDNDAFSGSNYSALKITDDMFKGGVEQSNMTEEKPLNEIDRSNNATKILFEFIK